MQQIFNILNVDSSCRYEGITDDLYSLHHLSDNAIWNYELPTLMNRQSEYIKKRFIRNNNKFCKKFYDRFNIFNNVDLSHNYHPI